MGVTTETSPPLHSILLTSYLARPQRPALAGDTGCCPVCSPTCPPCDVQTRQSFQCSHLTTPFSQSARTKRWRVLLASGLPSSGQTYLPSSAQPAPCTEPTHVLCMCTPMVQVTLSRQAKGFICGSVQIHKLLQLGIRCGRQEKSSEMLDFTTEPGLLLN